MADKSISCLVVGFNTRPLAYSLNRAGYDVYAVDFFGDLDLFPYVNDSIVILQVLNSNYNSLKDKYSQYLVQYAIKLYYKHQDTHFFLIGSGLDDDYEGRKLILDELKTSNIKSVNNDLEIIERARNIESIFEFLKSYGYKIPRSFSFEDLNIHKLNVEYPFILKKKRSAGGINVFKIRNEKELFSHIKSFEEKFFNPNEWLIQEYIEGIPVSCTVISNGEESEVISINRQIIGMKCLNSPKCFMYCGNIVPAGISKDQEKIISEISVLLTKKLGLKGINGFDFVLKDNYPYLMECNPRIPGSIRASEIALDLNLLDLHIKSFIPNQWNELKKLIKNAEIKYIATKLIYFAPKKIDKKIIPKINNLKYIHDKSESDRDIIKGDPLCSILYKAKNHLESYNGALKIVEKINNIIK